MWRDDAVILDLLHALEKIQDYTRGLTVTDFEEDEKTQSAVLYQMLVLGEATKRLSDEFRKLHPTIAWKDIAGMRDKCIHGYDDIDFSIVWECVKKDIPHLHNYLKPLISKNNI